MEKKIRGMYKIDYAKTPQENITEILKLTMPIELTLNKMQGGNSSYSDRFEMDGVTISAIGNYKYDITTDTKNFRRIAFDIKVPGQYRGRGSSKSWSVKVEKDGKVSLSWVAGIFKELSEIYLEAKKVVDKRKEGERLLQEKINTLRQKSGISDGVNLSQYSKEADRYSIYLNVGDLTEDQVIKMAPLYNEIIEINRYRGTNKNA